LFGGWGGGGGGRGAAAGLRIVRERLLRGAGRRRGQGHALPGKQDGELRAELSSDFFVIARQLPLGHEQIAISAEVHRHEACGTGGPEGANRIRRVPVAVQIEEGDVGGGSARRLLET